MIDRVRLGIALSTVLVAAALAVGCGEGLQVPDEEPVGAIAGKVTYLLDNQPWPHDSTIFDIRFVAMRFVPTDTADFLQLNRMAISNSLRTQVRSDSFFIGEVAPGAFPYSGIAYRFSPDIFDWKPIGLYEQDQGIFTVSNEETTRISIVVDFSDLPVFPPQ